MSIQTLTTPEDTFAFGEKFADQLAAGDIVLLIGGLGAGKTLFTKGVMSGLGYDVDEVTSPSFSLVNLYKTERFDVYHIDLWRLDKGGDIAGAVGLDEISGDGNAVTLIEWADRLGDLNFTNRTFTISISGDGDDARTVTIEQKS
ncbi:MAG TPA: tRNA (adenosine(37)-N6)-threonylcarbamoyltransferase complex ATPase subunit type 1 TsaE [Pyrinomonadaceae bacterium]|nr:tRNA (adenosine(37)-N6)-threonylcarbamoyltransferase complex ATPase subunit type 1 TsaE [Pyrinomonadaceae bacterium]